MKTSELTDIALDWAVCFAERMIPLEGMLRVMRDGKFAVQCDGESRVVRYNPSTDWAQGGPIIEREVIVLTHPKHDCWTATAQDSTDLDVPLYQEDGTTPLIAAMRCYVASKLGDEVEIPEELTQGEKK